MNSYKKIRISSLELLFLSIIIITFILLDRTKIMNMDIAMPAYIILIISLLYLALFVTKLGITKSNNRIILFYLIIYSIFMILYSFSTDINDINYAIRIIVYFSIVFLFSNIQYSRKNIVVLIIPYAILIVYIFIDWLTLTEAFKYSSFFKNPNTLGIVMYNILFLQLLVLFTIKIKVIRGIFALLVSINLLLIYVSTSRAVWLALLVSLAVYISYEFITKSKIRYKFTFVVVYLMMIVFSYMYPRLYNMEIGWKINNIVFNITGKNFFTGRQDLWSSIIIKIEEKKILGYGLSTSSKELIGTNHEAHNLFLNILLQTGFIGLLLYSILLYLIWVQLYPSNIKINRENKHLKLFPSYLMGMTIYQGFELSFIQGAYSTSIVEWLIIAIGLSYLNFTNGEDNKMEAP